jgi:hypothetical protein
VGSGSLDGSFSGVDTPDSPQDPSGDSIDYKGISDSTDASPDMTGILELGLTDASADYQAVYITVAEVDVKIKGGEDAEGESGWVTVVKPEQTYNLLDLMNGVIAPMGAGELEVGQYGQLRLILSEDADELLNILGEAHPYANYLIDGEGNSYELKVPSGFKTGIKIINGFSITTAQATELVLDFDAARSVVQAGKKGKFLLKPTIKVLETVESSADGVIADNEGEPLEGVVVSAQFYDPDAVDPKDQVTVESTTMSTAEGSFTLLLPPDSYNIVATLDGYLPACQEGVADFSGEYSSEISMTTASETITISGSVTGLDSTEDSVILSIRQEIDCGSGLVMIEIASVSVANDSNFEDIILPFETGLTTYNVVASAEGKVTQVIMDIIEDTDLLIAMETVQ